MKGKIAEMFICFIRLSIWLQILSAATSTPEMVSESSPESLDKEEPESEPLTRTFGTQCDASCLPKATRSIGVQADITDPNLKTKTWSRGQ